MYIVRDYKNKIIEGKFYAQELQKVIKPDKWPVEIIIKKHKDGRVLVKFLGYPEYYWTRL